MMLSVWMCLVVLSDRRVPKASIKSAFFEAYVDLLFALVPINPKLISSFSLIIPLAENVVVRGICVFSTRLFISHVASA